METEEDIKILESIIKINNDYLKGVENQTINQKEIKALEHILSDYKKLQEEFRQVDHECDRLEKIDFEKDMKIKELKKENEELKEINNELEAEKNEAIRRYNFESIPVSLVEEKIEELKEEIEQLRIERNVTYDSGIYRNQIKIDILQELLESEE